MILGQKTKLIHARVSVSFYSNVGMINMFHSGIRFSNTGLKEEVILDPCLGKKRVNMDSSGNPSASYFYLHLPIIKKLRGLIPFTYFEIDLLVTISDTPS